MRIFSDVIVLEYIFRIFLAGICGLLIGIERKNRSKEAGTRTHFMVACGAALIMVVSKYAFFDVITQGIYNGIEVRLDPSRVASTIASGIGFLGAGMIFVHKNNITGLTTAAGIWATSGVGMAIGAGMYSIGIASTVMIIVAQIVLHLRGGGTKLLKTKTIIIKDVEDIEYNSHITEVFNNLGVKIVDVTIDKVGSARNYVFTLEFPLSVDEDLIVSAVEYNCLLKV
ncbi:MAG: MgtC/SapB family protein [Clostridia bacterium]|nr:MgtC/SapB family protein [Clostridia bacterium]